MHNQIHIVNLLHPENIYIYNHKIHNFFFNNLNLIKELPKKLELDNHSNLYKPQQHLLFAPHRRHSFPAPSLVQVPTFAAAEKSFYYHFCCSFLTSRGKHEMWSKQSKPLRVKWLLVLNSAATYEENCRKQFITCSAFHLIVQVVRLLLLLTTKLFTVFLAIRKTQVALEWKPQLGCINVKGSNQISFTENQIWLSLTSGWRKVQPPKG